VKYLKTFEQFVNESLTFDSLYQSKNKWIQSYKDGEKDKILDGLYVLFNNSYGPLSGFIDDESLSDLFDIDKYEWSHVEPNIDSTNDTVLITTKTPYGKKVILIGHSGLKNGRTSILKKLSMVLKKPGYWQESSSRTSEYMYASGVPYLETRKEVTTFYNEVEWLNDRGWYYREVNDKSIKMTLFGRPIF
jgi:hypothetical protein